jgi:hypothetical protein
MKTQRALAIALMSISVIAWRAGGATAQQADQAKLDSLAKAMKDPTLSTRLNAIEEAGKLGDAAAPLARQICEAALDPATGKAALKAFGKVRPDLAGTLTTLLDPKTTTYKQILTLDFLPPLGNRAEPLMPLIWSQARRLESSGQVPPAARARLLQAYFDTAMKVDDSRDSLKKIADLAAEKNDDVVRGAALRALAPRADKDESVQKLLTPLVQDGLKDPKVRLAAVEAARHLGVEAKTIRDALTALKNDKDELTRLTIIATLARIDGDDEPLDNLDARAKIRLASCLEWLGKNQTADGSWQTDTGNHHPGITVCTSFCALAAMADKKYQNQVNKAVNFVATGIFQKPFADKLPPEVDQSNWTVAVGGLFLCEYYAASKRANPKYKSQVLQQTVDKLGEEIFKRMEDSGGWGHTPKLKNPLGYVELEIVSAWMLATAGSLQQLGVKLPDKSLQKALQFVDDCCAAGKGDVGYSPRPAQKGFGCPCRTGASIFAFASLHQRENPLFPRMVAAWKKSMERSDDGHGSVAMGLLGSALGARAAGAEEWKDFKRRFFPDILATVNVDGSCGRLPGRSAQSFGGADGRLGSAYNTGIYALILGLDRSEWSAFAAKGKD